MNKIAYVPGSPERIPDDLLKHRRDFKVVGKNLYVQHPAKQLTADQLRAKAKATAALAKITLAQAVEKYGSKATLHEVFTKLGDTLNDGKMRKATDAERAVYEANRDKYQAYVAKVQAQVKARRDARTQADIAKAIKLLNSKGIKVVKPAAVADYG